MRQALRFLALFLIAVGTMAVAYWAGFKTADRVRDVMLASRPVGPHARLLGPYVVPADVAPTSVAATAGPLGTAGSAETAVADRPPPAVPDQSADFGPFWDALEVVRSAALKKPLDEKHLTYGAIQGSLQSLDDPYTLFSDPVDTAVQSTELESHFEGIGAYVTTTDDGRLMIQTPMRGQPAEKAGIRAGDIVIMVDGVDITDMEVSEAVLLIRGPKGTTVRLTIVREGLVEPIVIAVVRDRIEIPSVNGVTLLADRGAPDIGYLQLTVFAAETREELIGALDELRDLGARALILDLRNNPGGFLNTAVDVASEFLDGGVVVVQENSQGRRTEMDARRGGHALALPLVVLVNRGSASASEIVAGAIRDRQRGVLVGDRTFGKGSVQNVHKLSDGSELRVTVAVWLTPNGTLIHKTGITPDVAITPTAEPTAPASAVTPPPTLPPGSPRRPSPAATPTRPGTATADADTGQSATSDLAEDAQLERAIVEARRLLEGR